MNKIQETDLNCFLAVEKVVNDNMADLADFPEITSIATLIADRKGKIQAFNAVQLNGARDQTGFKTSIRVLLEEKYAQVVKAIEGNISDNPGLIAKYKYIKPSDLKAARDGEVISMVAQVVADARLLGAKMTRFGITAALLSEMETLATNYDSSAANKSTAAGLSTSATADMLVLFDEVNKAMRNADMVVKPMEKLKPVFFKAWFEARKKQGT